MKVTKAVIPAAGLGTRFLPATKAQPKEMLPLIDKPAIQYIVEEAVASGIKQIIIITGRGKRAIEDHFDRSVELEMRLDEREKSELLAGVRDVAELADLVYIRQKQPLGLGHAIGCAAPFLGDEPFAVLLGDDVVVAEKPCLKQLMDFQEQTGGTVLGVQQVPATQVSRYGIVAGSYTGDRSYRVTDMVEKPETSEAPSQLAIMGRYILEPAILPVLKSIEPGVGGEIQLTDALHQLLQDGHRIDGYVYEGHRYDVGTPQGFLQSTVDMALRRADLREPFAAFAIGALVEHGFLPATLAEELSAADPSWSYQKLNGQRAAASRGD